MGRGKLTENKAEKDEVLPTQALATWTENRGPISLQIGLSTFGILALELALIRWTSGQIRVFAYFKNLVLISSFLGMGLGVALGRKYSGLVHYTRPALFLLSIPLAFSRSLHLMHLPFPDQTFHLWGLEYLSICLGLRALALMALIFYLLALFYLLRRATQYSNSRAYALNAV
jgi:hypothetical protein